MRFFHQVRSSSSSSIFFGLLGAPQRQQQIRCATKKAGGSSSNGRDSAGRRLGVKVWPNRPAKAGSIIVRQRGAKFKPGNLVGMGRDHTIFAKVAGIVRMERMVHNRKRLLVHIDPTVE